MGGCLVFEDFGDDFDLVVEAVVAYDVADRSAGSGFLIPGGEDQAGDAGLNDCARTHSARLQSDG